MLANYIRQALTDPRAQRLRFVPQHVAEPMPAFLQHARQETLDIAPVIVEPLKQELHVSAELCICLREDQSATCSAVVKLPRPIRNRERAARLRGDGQLARQSE